jgi:lysophospholipase L1-like esterase
MISRPSRVLLVALLGLLTPLSAPLTARDLQPKPADPFFARYEGWLAPKSISLLLKKGDRLAICGDSITEQKLYSVLLESYLTACLPEFEVTCRQYGWSGEQAAGFLARMKNDVLRFHPTIATTCYGMNDHHYVPYTDDIGATYRRNQTAIVKLFKDAGVRVVLGSPGTIASVPAWVRTATGTWEDLNASLCQLRNIDIEIAETEHVGFADVYWPMLMAMASAPQKYGKDFAVSGKDGVHPGWAGQVIMASAFLEALGVTGDLGTITVDLAANRASARDGHAVRSCAAGKVELSSSRWPFCADPGPLDRDDSLRAGMALADFDTRFNRLVLKVSGLTADRASVTWGAETKTFSKDQLAAGVNLAGEFQQNPFSEPFKKLWKSVTAKQEYETRQIKQIIHGLEGGVDMDAAVALTEKVRARLAEAERNAIRPLDHTLVIQPLP